jgi:hypothetical protein
LICLVLPGFLQINYFCFEKNGITS